MWLGSTAIRYFRDSRTRNDVTQNSLPRNGRVLSDAGAAGAAAAAAGFLGLAVVAFTFFCRLNSSEFFFFERFCSPLS